MSRRFDTLFAAALAAGALVAPLAHADQARGSSCFAARELDDWKSPGPDVIYVRANANDVFRLDLSTGSDQLKYSDVHLTSRNPTGPAFICNPADLNPLILSDSHDTFTQALIVKSITRLTPGEIAAIPLRYRP